MNHNSIYIVLIQSNTRFAKVARKITNYRYTHIAISLSDKLEEFYSFARYRYDTPLHAGFVKETRMNYIGCKHESFYAKVYRLDLDASAYQKVMDYIERIQVDSTYMFNLFSMLMMPIIHGFKMYKCLNCMSFVAEALYQTDKYCLNKPYYKYAIQDIEKELLDKVYYEGVLYNHKQVEDLAYFKKTPIMKRLSIQFNVIVQLFLRIFKRGD